MAVDTGDPKSGFRHCDVIVFINEEVLRNGGGPGFYLTFRSRPWKDIEDGLKSIVADTRVPCTIKRACAWSALALGVRVAKRQQEKQSRRVQQLHNQVEEHEAAACTLATDLQRLREERDEVISELRNARDHLQQVLHECDMLHKRLIEFELSQQLLAESQDTEYTGTLPWPRIIKEHLEALDTGLENGQYAVTPKKDEMAPVSAEALKSRRLLKMAEGQVLVLDGRGHLLGGLVAIVAKQKQVKVPGISSKVDEHQPLSRSLSFPSSKSYFLVHCARHVAPQDQARPGCPGSLKVLDGIPPLYDRKKPKVVRLKPRLWKQAEKNVEKKISKFTEVLKTNGLLVPNAAVHTGKAPPLLLPNTDKKAIFLILGSMW
ncbi:hypothetical protein STEG23_009089 [Scotinomys teguina]